MNEKRKIYIVDDHQVVRDGLRSLISQQKDLAVSGEAGDAAQALADIKLSPPCVVLADLSLRNESGFELLKELALQHPEIPVLVLSMHDEMTYAERALRAGARGYVMKSDSSHQLLIAIRRVLEGKVFVSDSVMASIASKLGNPKSATSAVEILSERELQVFEGIGQGLSTTELAERMNLSPKTVQVYFARVKEKFGVSSARELLREAFRWHDNVKATDKQIL